jgi:hypothetical protein
MKTKIILFLSLIIFHFATNKSIAQNFNGKANIVEFTNASAKFTVPVGKTWIIQNILSDVETKFKVKDNWNNGELNHCSVYVFIKSINGIIKTDLISEQYSRKINNNNDFHPIYLPENTTIEFLIVYSDGSTKTIKNFDGSATLNYIEITN